VTRGRGRSGPSPGKLSASVLCASTKFRS
jgi:hypothetical protein